MTGAKSIGTLLSLKRASDAVFGAKPENHDVVLKQSQNFLASLNKTHISPGLVKVTHDGTDLPSGQTHALRLDAEKRFTSLMDDMRNEGLPEKIKMNGTALDTEQIFRHAGTSDKAYGYDEIVNALKTEFPELKEHMDTAVHMGTVVFKLGDVDDSMMLNSVAPKPSSPNTPGF